MELGKVPFLERLAKVWFFKDLTALMEPAESKTAWKGSREKNRQCSCRSCIAEKSGAGHHPEPQ
jgi:hypothetical protein